jgi:hypothetical protein
MSALLDPFNLGGNFLNTHGQGGNGTGGNVQLAGPQCSGGNVQLRKSSACEHRRDSGTTES